MGAVFALLVAGALVVAFFVSLARRRHGESSVAAADWTSTEEVFKDPATQRLMRVWLGPEGERHYVPEK